MRSRPGVRGLKGGDGMGSGSPEGGGRGHCQVRRYCALQVGVEALKPPPPNLPFYPTPTPTQPQLL